MDRPPLPAPAPAPRLLPAGRNCQAIAIGCSAGGLEAVKTILTVLSADYPLPLLLVQHLHPLDEGRYAQHLSQCLPLNVIEASDKEPILAGRLYVAPAGYHMLVEQDRRIALSTEAKVISSRPSIDVLFDSAARVWAEGLVCIVLSGASQDGAAGGEFARLHGGLVVAQDPATASSPTMPQAVIDRGVAGLVLTPEAIGQLLLEIQRSHELQGGSA